MPQSCVKCGAPLDEEQRFCSACGCDRFNGPVEPGVSAGPSGEPTAPTYASPAPARPGKDEPISTLGYFGIFLLLSLPVVNLILLIVWACGGCAKDAKTRLARGALIYGLLCLILLLIGVILGILFWPMFQKWWMMVGAAFTFY